MKPLYYSLFFFLLTGIFYFLGASSSYGQLKGISLGNSSPHTNSILDISSTEKGVLFPRMTTAERQAIAIDAVVPAGLWVYDTDESAYYFYKKDKWELLGDSTFSKIRAFKRVGTDSLYLYQGKDSIGVQLALPGGGTIQNPDTADLSIRARNEGLVAGNARGIHSVDLQTKKDSTDQVASKKYATLSGGKDNTASGEYSTVSGGGNNIASGDYSAMSGGGGNTASEEYSTLSGGGNNTASGDYSAVIGGGNNTASGDYSTLSGGRNSTASGDYSAVSGGHANKAPSYGEWVGGLSATTYTPKSTISFNDSDRLFVVGNGTNTSTRSNALTLLKNAHLGIGISTPQQRLDLGGSAQDGLLRLGNVITTPTNSDSAKGAIAYNYRTNDPQYYDGTIWIGLEGGLLQDTNPTNLNIRTRYEGTVAGNARGVHSVSLQMRRYDAESVASGEYSTLIDAEESHGQVSGSHATAINRGAITGDYSTGINGAPISGNYAVVIGGTTGVKGDGEVAEVAGHYSTLSADIRHSASTTSYGEWIGGLSSSFTDQGNTTGFDENDRLFVVANGKTNLLPSISLVIFKSGDATSYNGLLQPSDRRLKKNIEKLECSLDTMGMLAPQKFYWRDTSRNRRGKSVGLIAQEVEQVFPHLVTTQEGTMGINGVQIDRVKSVNYIGFIPYLIHSHQELNVQIEAEQQLNNKLRTELGVERKKIQDMALEIEKMKSIFQDMAALETVDQP